MQARFPVPGRHLSLAARGEVGLGDVYACSLGLRSDRCRWRSGRVTHLVRPLKGPGQPERDDYAPKALTRPADQI